VEIETLDGPEARIVVTADATPERWIDVRAAERLRLERAGATSAGARRLAAARCPGQLSAALEAGPAFLGAASAAAACEDEKVLAPPSARVLAPLDPVAYRDFMAFEQHFVTATQKLRGTPPPPVLHELPVSYFGNAHAVLGPDEEIPWPHYTDHMDYELELELGIVIGTAGRSIPPEDALGHVLGLSVFNDFTARDIQLREMAAGLGPSKGKHFASALGPRIVTLDALPGALEMAARVNGEVWSEGSTGTLSGRSRSLLRGPRRASRWPPGRCSDRARWAAAAASSSTASSSRETSSSSRSKASACCETGSASRRATVGCRPRERLRRSPESPAATGPPASRSRSGGRRCPGRTRP